jgi:hypothetical protein
MTTGRRLLRRGACWCVLTSVCAALCWVTVGAAAASDALTPERALLVRLRSFSAGATAQLEIEPSARGGRVRLTANNLPPPNVLAPTARVYLAWATGGRILRLGELRRDARGNAKLEFAHPAPLERYSLIVTAEENAHVDHPGGAPVFSTRANEVTPLFPAPVAPVRAADTAPRPRLVVPTPSDETARTPALAPVVRAKRGTAATDDFFTSIDNVLAGEASAREITLVGVRRSARRARGSARVATADGTAYVRARFRHVPAPARFGASRYVLWGTTPAGRSVYLGSLPRRGLNNTDTYTRARGMDATQFDLLVTAERGRRVRGTRRVLATVRSQRIYQGRQRQ